MIFSAEKPNMSRQYEFDILKALAIFFMVIIHVYEELSAADIDVLCTGFQDVVLQFLAGPLAAPVFMMSMGVGMVYTRHRAPRDLMKRGLQLLIMAYVLNLLRDALLSVILFGFDDELGYLFFNVDVLQFAGLAFLTTGLLKKLKVPVLCMGVIAVLMQIVGGWVSSLVSFENVYARCFAGLIFYTGTESCFPLLTWYIYPALGIIFANILQHVEDTDSYYLRLLGLSATVLVGLCFSLSMSGYDIRSFFALAGDIYYQQDFLSVIFTMSVVILVLSAAHFAVKPMNKAPKLMSTIKFLSSNLNEIYLAQWLLIGWSCTILEFIETTLPAALVVPVGIVYTLAAIAAVKLYLKLKGRKQEMPLKNA